MKRFLRRLSISSSEMIGSVPAVRVAPVVLPCLTAEDTPPTSRCVLAKALASDSSGSLVAPASKRPPRPPPMLEPALKPAPPPATSPTAPPIGVSMVSPRLLVSFG